MDRKIDFMIIGVQKGGTTTVHDWLAQHPNIVMPPKDLLFFLDAGPQETTEEQFHLHFPNKISPDQIIGGSQVQHIFFHSAIERLHDYNPEMKLLAILRNPIDRAYSSYWYARLNIWESSSSFETALEREHERGRGSFREQAELTYLSHGHYADQLETVYSRFNTDQVLVLLTEDLKQPDQALTRILSFAGLPPDPSPIDTSSDSNMAGVPRSRAIQRVLMMQIPIVRELYRGLVPPTFRQVVVHKYVAKLQKLNRRPQRYPPMSAETRNRLREYFEPHNRRLSAMLGRDLSSWQ